MKAILVVSLLVLSLAGCSQPSAGTVSSPQAAAPVTRTSATQPTLAATQAPRPSATPTLHPLPKAEPAPQQSSTSVAGVWVDRAQPDMVEIEFGEDGTLDFRMRMKVTVEGEPTSYGDWMTILSSEWRQSDASTVEFMVGGKTERWQIRDGVLVQPTSTGVTEFIRK